MPEQAQNEIPPPTSIFLRELIRPADSQPLSINDPSNPIILTFSDFNLTKAHLFDKQSKCNFVKNINRKLIEKSKSAVDNFILNDNILYKKLKDSTQKLVLPEDLAIEFLSYLHSLHLHPGIQKLAQIAMKFIYAKSIHELCARINKNCLRCLSLKSTKTISPSQIKFRAYECLPFAKVGIDIYDLGTPDRYGKRYLFTLTDHLTNYVDGIALSNKNDSQVSRAFAEIILRLGVCGDVILDNGLEFTGPLFTNVCKKFKLQLHRISPYHSRSNGKAERSHREILIKQKLLGCNRSNWSTMWPFVQAIINNTPKESLNNLTPSECVFGRILICQKNLLLNRCKNSQQNYGQLY